MKVRNVLTQPEQIDAAGRTGLPYGLTGREVQEVQEVLVCWCGWLRGKTQGQAGVGRVNGRHTAAGAAPPARPPPTRSRSSKMETDPRPTSG